MKMFRKYQTLIFLLILLTAGLFFRVYNLENLPVEMHRDEAAITYNAYSLLMTGRGEHGEGPWPTVFKSYGDNKLPGLVYLTTAGLKVMAVSTWSARLPSALLGSLLILIIYLLGQELWQDKQKSLLASFLLVFSMWHVFLSRTIYEPIAGLTLSTLALVFLLKARKNPVWLFLSGLFFLLSCLTYNLPLLLFPLLLLGTLYIYRHAFLKDKRLVMGLGLGSMVLAILVSQLLTSSLISGRMSATIFSSSEIASQVTTYQDQLILSGIHHRLAKLVINTTTVSSSWFLKGYLSSFDLSYLFFKGGDNPWHSLGVLGLGNHHPALLVLILVGVWQLLQKLRSKKSHQFLLFYLLISPIPSALTIDSHATNRLMDFHLALTLTAALGLSYLLLQRRKIFVRLLLIVWLGWYVFNISNFWLRYSILHAQNLSAHWPEGIKEVVLQANEVKNRYSRIYLDLNNTPEKEFAYIYFLLYTQYDPALLHSEAVWNQDQIYLTAIRFPPFEVKNLPNLSGMGIDELLELFPPQTQKILVIEKIGAGGSPNSESFYVSYDSQNHPNWQMRELDRDEVLKY